MILIQQSEATASLRRLFFQAVDATDGITAETGLAGAGRLSKAGAATAATGNITEIDSTNMPGRYYVQLTATEVNTLGVVEFRFKTAACAEVAMRGLVVAVDLMAASNMGITNLDATISSRSSHNAAAVWSSATRTLTAFGFSVALTSSERNSVADALLTRDWNSVTGEAARSVLNALRFLRNRWSISGTTLTVTEEDDVTAAWTAVVTTDAAADPVTGSDPA